MARDQLNRLFGLKQGDPLRVSIHGLFGLAILYTLYLAHEVILPITLAVLASLLLAPLVNALARRGLPKVIGAGVLLLLLVSAIAGTTVMVSKPMLEWLEHAPRGISRLLVQDGEVRDLLDRMTTSAREVEDAVGELREGGAAAGEEPTTVVLESESWRGQLLVNAWDSAAAITLALALSYFLLVSGNRLIANYVAQLPTRQKRRDTLYMVRDCQREMARYLAVITVSNSLVGILTAIMAWAVGLPSPAVWGVLATLLRFVPYLGVVITVGLLLLVSAGNLQEPFMIVVVPLGYLLLNAIVGFFLEPWIHGYRLSVNPVLIFLSIFFWGWLWGPIGVLLAVPLMTMIQVVLRHVQALQPLYRVISR